MSYLGTAMIWFGWLAFNGASGYSPNSVAVNAYIGSNMCLVMCTLTWFLLDWIVRRKISTNTICYGVITWLAAFTPCAGFVSPLLSLVVGITAGAFCYGMWYIKTKSNFDDTLDVLCTHGAGGLWGLFMNGLIASLAVNPDGANGAFYGNPMQLVKQLAAIAVTAVWATGMSYVLALGVNFLFGLRVTEEKEAQGLDVAEHDEEETISLGELTKMVKKLETDKSRKEG